MSKDLPQKLRAAGLDITWKCRRLACSFRASPAEEQTRRLCSQDCVRRLRLVAANGRRVLCAGNEIAGRTASPSCARRHIQFACYSFLLLSLLINSLAAERPSPIWSLAFSPDGKTLAVGIHQQVLLLDTKSWNVRDSIPEFMDSVRCLRYSQDGKLLFVAGGYPKEIGEVVIFQTSDLEYIGGSEHHVDVVEDLAIHPAGKQYVTVSMDHSAIVTGMEEGDIQKILKHKDRVYAVALSPEGNIIVTGCADSRLRVWDMKGDLAASVQQQGLVIRCIRFFSSGKGFIAAHEDGQISEWSVVQTANDKWTLKQIRKQKGHNSFPVYGLGLVTGNKQFASAGADGRCVLWDTSRPKPILELVKDGDQLYAAAVSPNGTLAVAGGRSGRLHVVSLKDGKTVKTFVPPAPKIEEEPEPEAD